MMLVYERYMPMLPHFSAASAMPLSVRFIRFFAFIMMMLLMLMPRRHYDDAIAAATLMPIFRH